MSTALPSAFPRCGGQCCQVQSSGPMRLVDLCQKLGVSRWGVGVGCCLGRLGFGAADLPADALDYIFVVEVRAVDEFWGLAGDLFLDGGNQRHILFPLGSCPSLPVGVGIPFG